MKLLAEDKGIQLEADGSSPLLVRGDRYRIKQLLLNLIDNAIKYCPSGSQVHIRLASGVQDVVFEVEDNGPGIPQEALQHLTDRFDWVDKSGPVRWEEAVWDFPFAPRSVKRTEGKSKSRANSEGEVCSESACQRELIFIHPHSCR